MNILTKVWYFKHGSSCISKVDDRLVAVYGPRLYTRSGGCVSGMGKEGG